MKGSSFDLAALLRQDQDFSLAGKIRAVWHLSVPAILAQISSIMMQYIDAAMVGSLGASASASIGLVASSTWLFGGLCMAAASGFSVQVAQAVGAGDYARAKDSFKQAIAFCLLFSSAAGAAGAALSFWLPRWLGGGKDILADARLYFLIFALSLPVLQMVDLLGRMMQCSGNMKIPSILDILMCALDVAFNFVFIMLLKLGVPGAALGTLCAMLTVLILGVYFACFRSPVLRLRGSGKVRLRRECLCMAAKISLPMGFEQIALCGAMVLTTGIVAPLGTIAIAANSFAVTAESLCYMPGYGVASAATTLVGQSVGAGRRDLAKGFAWVTAGMGMTIMTLCGIIMYFACPAVFAFLTPDPNVRALGAAVLRLELIAEPLFAASIVANGALRGAGDTLVPGIMTLGSIWGVRLTLSLLLVRSFGLHGVWIAMAAELCVRGAAFLLRLRRGRWLKAVENELPA